MPRNWTDKKLRLLKEHWTEGNTAAMIARRLRMSRAAVLGKIFRLRLLPPAQKSEAAKVSSPVHRRTGRRFQTESQDPGIKRGKTLLELTNACCRWPIGDPAKKSFHFCGEPGADLAQGIPYCERHRQRAYERPRQSEPDRARTAGRDGTHRLSPAMQTAVQQLFQAAVARQVRP